MIDDFTDHPQTIGELRSERSQSCIDWKPRDARAAAMVGGATRKVTSNLRMASLSDFRNYLPESSHIRRSSAATGKGGEMPWK